ncbi:MAG: hypothetical protein U0414_19180 [Polyangiaceae bacterium]
MVGRRFDGAALVLGVVGLGGCCSYPTVQPNGRVGVFVRALPAEGGWSADSRAGEAAPPTAWPPAPAHETCTDGVHELDDLEASFGLTSAGCPAQYNPVPAEGGPSERRALGFNTYCFALDRAVLVVETTERLGSCQHIVGLALFPKAGG